MASDSLDRDVHFHGISIEQRELLMIQAAKRYYDFDITIGELARELRLLRRFATLNRSRQTSLGGVSVRQPPPCCGDGVAEGSRPWFRLLRRA